MKIAETLYVHEVRAWRAWLRKNHAKAREIWLVYYKKASGKPRISYNDAVDEAMCFGWIDSIMKSMDAERFCQRFSPRRKGSPCSELNKHRAIRMIQEKRMTPAGLAALEGTLAGARIHKGTIRNTRPLTVPPDILKRLKEDGAAWRFFRRFPETYRRIRIAWIEAARRNPSVFKSRLEHFLKRTAKNERFGMVQA